MSWNPLIFTTKQHEARATVLRVIQPERLGAHDSMTLMWLGLYPRWIMLPVPLR